MKSANLHQTVAISIFNDGGIEFGAFKLKSCKRWPGASLSPIFVNLRQRGSSQEHEGKLIAQTVDLIGQLIVARYGELASTAADYVVGIPSAGEPIVDAVMNHLPGVKRQVSTKTPADPLGGLRVYLVAPNFSYFYHHKHGH